MKKSNLGYFYARRRGWRSDDVLRAFKKTRETKKQVVGFFPETPDFEYKFWKDSRKEVGCSTNGIWESAWELLTFAEYKELYNKQINKMIEQHEQEAQQIQNRIARLKNKLITRNK